MRFSTYLPSIQKFAAVATALMILPVAVACNSATTTDDVAVEPSADTEVSSADESEETTADETTADAATIVDVAAVNGSFDTLVAAVQAADLVDTLSAEGPYTVFAPTDEAFAALPEGVLDTLLLPDNKETLQQILAYHVVPSEVPSSAISPGAVATVAGEEVTLSVDGGSVMVNEATVVQPDVAASNGIIHVIDTVLLPPSLDLSAL
ncbi:MAG: fasciclin domain-containing protein [Cyanobacteria bacterium J06621_11]